MEGPGGDLGLRASEPLPRIMIVDDREADARSINNTMAMRGYDLAVFNDPRRALEKAKSWKPAGAILDVKMPGMDGLTLCAKLKELDGQIFVVFVTSDDSRSTRAQCLTVGDDYVTKPIDGEELILRVVKEIRRQGAAGREPTSSQPLAAEQGLTPVEARLLEALKERAGETVSRYDLLDSVWGPDSSIALNTLDANIRRLRRKIEPDPKHPRIIVTVRTDGYKLNPAELRRAHVGRY
ncbi:MAG TPA: response regulator transcription factor [Ktedonobacterales bacterium]